MKILTGKMIREADRQTILWRPVTSIELMEEASRGLTEAMLHEVQCLKENEYLRYGDSLFRPIHWLVLAGKGNNGGDGLAVARLLSRAGEQVEVLLAAPVEEMTQETAANYYRLPEKVSVRALSEKTLAEFCHKSQEEKRGLILVDALLGTGVRGPVREPLHSILRTLNAADFRIWSIDLPSGLPTEPDALENGLVSESDVLHAEMTFTVAMPKLSMMFPETGASVGRLRIVPLKLDAAFIRQCESRYTWVDASTVAEWERGHARTEFMHKGKGGHALLVCGSVGMSGAAVLAAGGALRSGCGLVTLHLPECERSVVHAVHPAVIVNGDSSPHFSTLPQEPDKYTAVGVGCGLGQHEESVEALHRLMQWKKPMVLDADALNLMASHRELMEAVPEGSVMTPHIGELRRLIGDWSSSYDKMSRVYDLARRTRSCIVVKGAHTMTVTPQGQYFFNGSGNPGMAKGGSGDVLAGLITGLLAYGYSAQEAALIGVWRHGRAGDRAAECLGEDAMNSEDLAQYL